jgi:hypothetical protein
MTHAVRRAAADEEAARAIIDEYNDAVGVAVRDDALQRQSRRDHLHAPHTDMTASYAGARSNGFAREEPRC